MFPRFRVWYLVPTWPSSFVSAEPQKPFSVKPLGRYHKREFLRADCRSGRRPRKTRDGTEERIKGTEVLETVVS